MSDWKPPHEETWRAVYDDLFATQSAEDPEDEWERIFEGAIGLSGMEKRLKLAAAAPEMARLLLVHQADFVGTPHFDEIGAVLRKAGVIAS